jgi:hypothetical protein
MNKGKLWLIILVLAVAAGGIQAVAQGQAEGDAVKSELKSEEKLVVLWTSGDPEVATKMVFMYAGNAPRFGWWEDITLIVWGPSAKLLAESEELQGALRAMERSGIKLEACKACSDQYDVSDKLIECGIDVKYMGEALTQYIKEGRHVLTI